MLHSLYFNFQCLRCWPRDHRNVFDYARITVAARMFCFRSNGCILFECVDQWRAPPPAKYQGIHFIFVHPRN